jgi:curved DNA-binding protein CbpA
MAETTLYDILELSPTAGLDQIKAAYRRLSTQVHPDRGGSGALFRLVREAYEILSDDNLRAEYDQSGVSPAGVPRRARSADIDSGLDEEKAQHSNARDSSSVRMIPCSLCGVKNRVSPNAQSFSCGICKNQNLMLSCRTCGTQAYECKALSGNTATYVCETCHRENPERRKTERRQAVPD